ncbi:MAG: hypothetical protein K1X88_20315 [Nannocystaceae bacterium]|nr:hypothetical protein [Nannocystaceae bacterium]
MSRSFASLLPPRWHAPLRAALVPAAIAAAIASDGVLRWIAAVVAIACAPEAWAWLAARVGPDRRALLRRRLPLALLLLVALALLWPLVIGEPPASRDHAIHYFATRLLLDDMLAHGRLSGWTDRFNHGFPYGEGYPVLGYLWVAAPHLLSFGAIGLRTSYAWGLLALWLLVLWGTWRVAAAIADDVLARLRPGLASEDIARWSGCLAALAWLVDPGGSRLGGWNYLVFHGVWAQLLSTALWLAGLHACTRALQHPSPRRMAIAAAWLAGGLLAHPFGLLTTAISCTGLCVVALLADDRAGMPSGALRCIAIVHSLAVALAAGGLATFFAAAGELGRSPVAWSELGELGARLLTGELFAGQWAWTTAGFGAGLVLALWSGRARAWLVAAACIAMLVVASPDGITVLRLDLLVPGLENLQFPRFSLALKPLLFALSGATVAIATAAVLAQLQPREPAAPTWPRRVVIAALLGPVLATALARSDAFVHRPVGAIDTLAHSSEREGEAALREALIAEAAALADAGGPPLRVAFLRSGMGGGMLPMFAIADAGGAAVLDGHVATINFEWQIDRRSVSVLRRLAVTHVIHDRPLGDGDSALASMLTPVGDYGSYTLERFGGEPDTAPRFVRGSGTAEILEHDADHTRIAVDTRGGTLALSHAPSHRWVAELDGTPIETTSAHVHGGGMDLIAVELEHGGTLTLRYRRTTAERVAPWLSLVALLLAAAMLLRDAPWQPQPWPRTPARRRTLTLALLVVAAVIAALLVRRASNQLARTWESLAEPRLTRIRGPMPQFADDLALAGEIALERSDRRVCDGLLGKDALVDCEEGDHRPHLAFTWADPYLYRCLAFGLAAGDTAVLHLGRPGDRVIGFVTRRSNDSGPRTLRWRIHADDNLRELGRLRSDLHYRPEDHPGGARLELVNEGTDPEDVCVGAARFR